MDIHGYPSPRDKNFLPLVLYYEMSQDLNGNLTSKQEKEIDAINANIAKLDTIIFDIFSPPKAEPSGLISKLFICILMLC